MRNRKTEERRRDAIIEKDEVKRNVEVLN